MFTAAPWICRSRLHRLPRQMGAANMVPLTVRRASDDTKSRLHPALLARARSLAAEHASLATTLATSYDAKVAARLGQLTSIAAALDEWDTAHASLGELHGLVTSRDKELRALATDELASTTSRLGALTRRLQEALTPKHPFAAMPCLIEIMPGPGGTEGRFFADALFKMYRQLCANRGLPVQVVKYEMADAAGNIRSSDGESPLLEAVLEVAAEGAYDMFRTEAGMHRVQRVPFTESTGRIHTSAVAVWVLPSFPENAAGGAAGAPQDADDPTSDFYLAPQEVRVESMRSRGAGGQSVNKTESAVRLTHLPTGTTVSMQDHRSKQRNREEAWRLLRARVASQRRDAREEEASRLRDSVLAKDRITRSDKVRTYNFPQDRVTDHRSGITVHNLPDVIAGGDGLGRVMRSVGAWLLEREVGAMVREEEARFSGAK